MKKSIKNVVALILVFALSVCLCSCRASEKVSYNLSKEADDFGITRKITVINIRDNSVLYEIIAKCALQNEGNNELSIISEVGEGVYKKDFVYLSEWTTYIVEDVSGAYTDPYHYEINILPYLRGVSGNVTFEMEE